MAVPPAANLRCVLPLVLALVGTPAAAQPASSSPTTIVSAFVWDAANSPVPHVTVALRNLGTARIALALESDAGGHVSFRGAEAGTYVLEVVNRQGVIVAAGQIFTLAAGENVATFVRLAARSPWYAGLFENAGAIAVATAAGLGVTAVGTTGQPQSPGR